MVIEVTVLRGRFRAAVKAARSVALTWALNCALACAVAAALCAQQLKLNLNHLAAIASNSVDISLNNSMLQFAAKFLDGKDPDEAAVKKHSLAHAVVSR